VNVDARRSALTGVAVLYLVTAGIGTWLAVDESLVGQPFGWDLGLATLPSFVFGLGTALSAPLLFLVALVAAVVMLHVAGGDTRRASAGGIALLGSGFLIGMLAEPITWELLRFGPVLGPIAAIVVANIVLPVILVILAVMDLIQRQNNAVERQPTRP
jgi:hypothetical protein